ncbi:MAG: 16S rRNA (guanine(966)-N(2))-methyltransferase RsmD [Pseudodesulfovibrio sp.]|uniref:Methyltransferase n=1 Tax=Pseudodesulfovibrio aespoeensis (strain ATCC 700646 / DSM 10631 / Aspo-2) TaxID=643562 RepID=E6VZ25_PSEA9|nr:MULTISPECIES: 16S rRNA (guanine(966)-N(2))-methyltransferase RsmD [Pseudodesulfovibrio]MBU4245311.1 16S rRNA (guanine(966)-N(2))-methyltransferase RsmD [Pseudomonadota bacterium]MCG2731675.1 16S rRNA (guanine(966)-N(2))-methyltransferase RsmD [Pseudodesulfovibrio aespoeensis]ADU62801.1 methyltransferase [Pseudodesulfovibrio aespoeensis Aspo-2]MBU4379602.1 16S rRNA (guanine(966)-N(2))-methyltransferase RsmD [Pseudomonadota bacterium]MBU4475211.1 16S rRNA (guanine(966)-N(2))-methyltransferase
MRVVGGQFRGRSIRTCEGPGYRPATMKVRESIFSMLAARGADFTQARVMDMFAGSGSLGIECLSRGALLAWFIEKNARAAGLIRANLADLGVGKDRARVVAKDVFMLLSKPPQAPFDLIFIDPPYGMDLLLPALEKALATGWIAPGAFVLAEVEAAIAAPTTGPVAAMELVTDREYGQTRILLWRN